MAPPSCRARGSRGHVARGVCLPIVRSSGSRLSVASALDPLAGSDRIRRGARAAQFLPRAGRPSRSVGHLAPDRHVGSPVSALGLRLGIDVVADPKSVDLDASGAGVQRPKRVPYSRSAKSSSAQAQGAARSPEAIVPSAGLNLTITPTAAGPSSTVPTGVSLAAARRKSDPSSTTSSAEEAAGR